MSTNQKIVDYLGKPVATLLQTEPFNQWSAERSIETDLEEPIIQYVFRGHAMALRCDRDDRVNVIFLRADKHNSQDGNLFEVPFEWTRDQVLKHFGLPSKSGSKTTDPILGDFGAWDRFAFQDYSVHIEFRTERDEIRRITIMRSDAVP